MFLQGFKCEWATVKGDHLWIGSTGVLFPDKKKNETDDQTQDDVDDQEYHDDDHDPKAAADGEEEPAREVDNRASSTTPRQTGRPASRTRSKRQNRNKEDNEGFDKSRQFVKKITKDGRVIHADWTETYDSIASALGVNQKKGEECVAKKEHPCNLKR